MDLSALLNLGQNLLDSVPLKQIVIRAWADVLLNILQSPVSDNLDSSAQAFGETNEGQPALCWMSHVVEGENCLILIFLRQSAMLM